MVRIKNDPDDNTTATLSREDAGGGGYAQHAGLGGHHGVGRQGGAQFIDKEKYYPGKAQRERPLKYTTDEYTEWYEHERQHEYYDPRGAERRGKPLHGRVLWCHPDKPWGFIQCGNTQKKMFYHQRDSIDGRDLDPGEYINFESRPDWRCCEDGKWRNLWKAMYIKRAGNDDGGFYDNITGDGAGGLKIDASGGNRIYKLAVGATARLQNLAKFPDMNGLNGSIIEETEHSDGSKRWLVDVDGMKYRLKEENLECINSPVFDTPAGGGGGGGGSSGPKPGDIATIQFLSGPLAVYNGKAATLIEDLDDGQWKVEIEGKRCKIKKGNLLLPDKEDEKKKEKPGKDGKVPAGFEKMPEAPSRKLKLFNLQEYITDDDLYEIFGQFGKVKFARVHFDQKNQCSSGTAVLLFHRFPDALRAQQKLNRKRIDGRPVFIEMDPDEMDFMGTNSGQEGGRRGMGGRGFGMGQGGLEEGPPGGFGGGGRQPFGGPPGGGGAPFGGPPGGGFGRGPPGGGFGRGPPGGGFGRGPPMGMRGPPGMGGGDGPPGPREDMGMGGGGGGRGGPPRGFSDRMNGGGGGGSGFVYEQRPGDWACKCGFSNFARREQCFQCGQPKNG